MADKYRNFREMKKYESSNSYRIDSRERDGGIIILAPQAGLISVGTSEICMAVAGNEHSYYLFEGLKDPEATDLRLNCISFDEPGCNDMLGRSEFALSIIGYESEESFIVINGRSEEGRFFIGRQLESAGFLNRKIQGEKPLSRHRKCVCNRTKSGKGIQVEISFGLLRNLFESQARMPLVPNDVFMRFCTALREAVDDLQKLMIRSSGKAGR